MMSLVLVPLNIHGQLIDSLRGKKKGKDMEIQKILFPEIGRCTEEELYYRALEKAVKQGESEKKVVFDYETRALQLEKKGVVAFDTYFNGFSIEKWMKYTILKQISLDLEVLGKVQIRLVSRERVGNTVINKLLAVKNVEAKEKTSIIMPFVGGDNRGMYAFEVEAFEDSVIYGGAYISEIKEECLKEVKIGISICTFRREAFIEKNLRILRETVLENKQSPLHGHLEVFVSDNGKTLDIPKLATKGIHIFPNKNYGGAGGFTRDLIEIMSNNDKYQVTHALLMDDDIIIEPESLLKTYKVLALRKDQYEDTFIGGAMLRLDQPTIQVEAGAAWNGGALVSHKHNLNLAHCEACLYNEMEEYTEFNAWWYCCFPMKIVTPDNLPLPIFIRGDDLEYGLRNMKNLILMNGICVWHEPFENKYSSFLEYYIIRNQLIDNSFHCPWYGKKQLIKTLIKHCFNEIMFYRYKNVDLYLRGINDFFKGPQWLMKQDSEKLHQEIMGAGYRGQDLETLDMPFYYATYENSCNYQDGKYSKWKRLFTFNGLIFSAKGDNIVPMAGNRQCHFYRKKRVMHYDVAAKKAFITERSFGTSVSYIFKVIGM